MSNGGRFIGRVLEDLAPALDISPTKYSEAVSRYTAVGTWLDAPDSPLKSLRPAVYPQGSFRLGTVVRPVIGGREADYDIDLVCCMHSPKTRFEARDLKHMVGDRLKAHATYKRMLDEEGRRCWTLNYAESDGVGFHLDALPAVFEEASFVRQLVARGVSLEFARHAIGISERLPNRSYVWLDGGSNPLGYATWFDGVNEGEWDRAARMQKQRLFEAHRTVFESVQDVPDALVRTPLMRVIQFLKRHRDVRFAGHKWEADKPISMIITTLAARAYRGEQDVATALTSVLERIDDFATTGVIKNSEGGWFVGNPVNPGENFADRWNENGSNRAAAFFEWLAWARQDLALAAEQTSEAKSRSVLAESLGLADGGPGSSRKTGAPVPVVLESVPALADSSHCQSVPWPIQEKFRVTVSASVRRRLREEKNLWQLSGRGVPKEFAILFRAETNARGSYDVKWQVVNTGAEAAAAGRKELRGGFDDGEGDHGAIRWEKTAYRGTHWIEAFVVKNGVCVARSGHVDVRVT